VNPRFNLDWDQRTSHGLLTRSRRISATPLRGTGFRSAVHASRRRDEVGVDDDEAVWTGHHGRVLRALAAKWTCLAVAVWVTTGLLSDVRVDGGVSSYLLVAAVFATANVVLGPVVRLLTLPLRVLTLGLFSLVVNGFMLLVTDWLMDSFDVGGFANAFVAALVITVVSTVLDFVFRPRRNQRHAST
jgi:putative membrane protein